MIQLLRVDHRLLHGQVAVSWVQGLGSDCIFCVGDKVANDPVWKTTLKMGKPANVKLVIKDMEHAIEAINSGVTDKYKMIICVASIAEAKATLDAVVDAIASRPASTAVAVPKEPAPADLEKTFGRP